MLLFSENDFIWRDYKKKIMIISQGHDHKYETSTQLITPVVKLDSLYAKAGVNVHVNE